MFAQQVSKKDFVIVIQQYFKYLKNYRNYRNNVMVPLV
jgi:hypothetical protein